MAITTPLLTTGSAERPVSTRPAVDIVVPVYNEEGSLERSVRRLHTFLRSNLPFVWRIVIADNASVDGTLAIARRLADEGCRASRSSTSRKRGAVAHCGRRGRAAIPTSSATWTSTLERVATGLPRRRASSPGAPLSR